MAWKLRIDALRTDGQGRPSAFVSSQTLAGSGPGVVQSAAGPDFGVDSGVARSGIARVSVLSGAVIAAWADAAPADDGGGVRIEAGASLDVPYATGTHLNFIEAQDAPISKESHLGEVGGASAVVAASFTRPANTTAYAVGALVANSTAAGSVAPLACAVARKVAGTGLIRRARLSSSNAAAVGASFRIHLFKTAPTSTVGDGGVFAGAVNGLAAIHLGYFDVTLDRSFSDGAKGVGAPAVGTEIVFDAAAGSQSIYALVEARSAYVPASGETLTVALEALRD
jgi:hypothetical protein